MFSMSSLNPASSQANMLMSTKYNTAEDNENAISLVSTSTNVKMLVLPDEKSVRHSEQ